MINPTDEDIGRGVVYRPKYGPIEDGVITSVNDRYVFVRYKKQHPSQPGQATRREDLHWSFDNMQEEEAKSFRRAVGKQCKKCGSNHVGIVDHVLEKYKCMKCRLLWDENNHTAFNPIVHVCGERTSPE